MRPVARGQALKYRNQARARHGPRYFKTRPAGFMNPDTSLAEKFAMKVIQSDKDLVVMGGTFKVNTFSNIYKLECINGQYQWQLLNSKLKKPRGRFVAAMIPTNFGNLHQLLGLDFIYSKIIYLY